MDRFDSLGVIKNDQILPLYSSVIWYSRRVIYQLLGSLKCIFISIPNYAFFIFAFVQKYAKILSKTIQNYAFTLKKSRNSVIRLEDSNLVHVCWNVYEPYLPLAANSKENEFKLYYNDTWLLLARYGFQTKLAVLNGTLIGNAKVGF